MVETNFVQPSTLDRVPPPMRARNFSWLSGCGAVLGFVLGFAGCSGDSVAPGGERGNCLPDGTCNKGLVCASDICISLEDTEGSAGSGPGRAEDDDGAGETGGGDASVSVSVGSDEGNTSESAGDSPCARDLLNCQSKTGGLDACGASYISCRNDEGSGQCQAAEEICEVLDLDPSECDRPWPGCTDGPGNPTGDPTGDPTGAPPDAVDPGCVAYASAYCNCLGEVAAENCGENIGDSCDPLYHWCPGWWDCQTANICDGGQLSDVEEVCGMCTDYPEAP